MNYTFGDTVIVENNLIGVVVKSWKESTMGRPAHYEVYVRNFNAIKEYEEHQMRRYLVRHKELDENEQFYQKNIENA